MSNLPSPQNPHPYTHTGSATATLVESSADGLMSFFASELMCLSAQLNVSGRAARFIMLDLS